MALGFLATTARSDEITLSLPADLTAWLSDALEHLREVATDRPRAAIDALEAQLAGSPPIELTGPRDLVRELIAVALDEAGERISAASTRLLRGEEAATELRTRLSEASALVELLERSSAAP